MAAPTYSETLDALYATTWVLRLGEIEDQIHNATPFQMLMTQKGKRTTQTGGKWIEHVLRYEKNETITYIGRGGSVSLQATDNLTTTHWEWRTLTGHIIRYFADFRTNRGAAAVKNRVNADIDTLRDGMIDQQETSLFHDASTTNEVDGLGNIVAESPGSAGTVGGIDQAARSWWRNRYKDMGGEDISVYLIKRMRTMFNDCGQQGQGVSRFPDICICSQDVHEAYEEESLEIGKILMGNKTIADLGFGESAFKGRPFTWSPACTAKSLYLLNTNFLEFVVDPIENMQLGKWLDIIDQPRDVVAHALQVGNLVCSNRKKQGVIFDIGEAS